MNIYKTSFYLIITLGLLVAGLHFAADNFSLYWRLWWFDIVMHFLGGCFVASLFIWSVYGLSKKIPSFFSTILFVLLIGLLWEVFEFSTGLTFTAMPGYPMDTSIDLILDIIGSCILVFFLFGRKRERISFQASPIKIQN